MLNEYHNEFPAQEEFWTSRKFPILLDSALRTGESTYEEEEEKFKHVLEQRKTK